MYFNYQPNLLRLVVWQRRDLKLQKMVCLSFNRLLGCFRL